MNNKLQILMCKFPSWFEEISSNDFQLPTSMYSRHSITYNFKALRTFLKSSVISLPRYHYHFHHSGTESVSSDPIMLVPCNTSGVHTLGLGCECLCSEPTNIDILHGQPSDKFIFLNHSQDVGHGFLVLIFFPGWGRKLHSLSFLSSYYLLSFIPALLGHLQSVSKYFWLSKRLENP